MARLIRKEITEFEKLFCAQSMDARNRFSKPSSVYGVLEAILQNVNRKLKRYHRDSTEQYEADFQKEVEHYRRAAKLAAKLGYL